MTRVTNFGSRGAPWADLHMKPPSTMGHESVIERRPSLSHQGWLKYFFRHTVHYSKLPYTESYARSYVHKQLPPPHLSRALLRLVLMLPKVGLNNILLVLNENNL